MTSIFKVLMSIEFSPVASMLHIIPLKTTTLDTISELYLTTKYCGNIIIGFRLHLNKYCYLFQTASETISRFMSWLRDSSGMMFK